MMGHYDSCRNETWALKDTECSGDKIKDKQKKKKFNKKHKWDNQGGGYGVATCAYCKQKIFWT